MRVPLIGDYKEIYARSSFQKSTLELAKATNPLYHNFFKSCNEKIRVSMNDFSEAFANQDILLLDLMA